MDAGRFPDEARADAAGVRLVPASTASGGHRPVRPMEPKTIEKEGLGRAGHETPLLVSLLVLRPWLAAVDDSRIPWPDVEQLARNQAAGHDRCQQGTLDLLILRTLAALMARPT